jgi:hypothetical protein
MAQSSEKYIIINSIDIFIAFSIIVPGTPEFEI